MYKIDPKSKRNYMDLDWRNTSKRLESVSDLRARLIDFYEYIGSNPNF